MLHCNFVSLLPELIVAFLFEGRKLVFKALIVYGVIGRFRWLFNLGLLGSYFFLLDRGLC